VTSALILHVLPFFSGALHESGTRTNTYIVCP
jgi:hypothetical protein